jgi:hypothetical protein
MEKEEATPFEEKKKKDETALQVTSHYAESLINYDHFDCPILLSKDSF